MTQTFIIAEAGANHNQNFQQALRLIDVAKQAGASACKFQTYSADTLYSRNTPDFAGYQNINQLIADIALNRDWQADLKQYCDEQDIEFMSTPFDAAAVEQLVKIGVKRLKIAGFEASDLHFVKMVAQTKLPLIISAGIGIDIAMMERILTVCDNVGNDDITFLHCNNAYPTPQEDVNLGTMMQMMSHFSDKSNINFGLSDHTLSPFTPALAVAMGATVIEKHFTLSRHLHGPDHPFALEPKQLTKMVRLIELAEQSLGVKQDIYTPSEQAFKHGRRSVVSARAIKAGTVLQADMLTTKRPFFDDNVPAMDFDNLIGKQINCDVAPDTPILLKWIKT